MPVDQDAIRLAAQRGEPVADQLERALGLDHRPRPAGKSHGGFCARCYHPWPCPAVGER